MIVGDMMKILFELLGGLGLFLYGMTVMGDGLEKAAGNKMKRIIEVLTNNRWVAMIVGIVVTMVKYISPENAARQLANAHTFFNVVNAAILLSFALSFFNTDLKKTI